MKILIIGENHDNQQHKELRSIIVERISNNNGNLLLGLEGFNYCPSENHLIRTSYSIDNTNNIFGIEDGDVNDFSGYLKCYGFFHQHDNKVKYTCKAKIFLNVVKNTQLMQEYLRENSTQLQTQMLEFIKKRNILYANVGIEYKEIFDLFLRNHTNTKLDSQWKNLLKKMIPFYHLKLSDKYTHVNDIVSSETLNLLIDLLEMPDSQEGADLWTDININLRDRIITENIINKIDNYPGVKGIALIIGGNHCDSLRTLIENKQIHNLEVIVNKLDNIITPKSLANQLFNQLVD